MNLPLSAFDKVTDGTYVSEISQLQLDAPPAYFNINSSTGQTRIGEFVFMRRDVQAGETMGWRYRDSIRGINALIIND
jgi:hypothetical protein